MSDIAPAKMMEKDRQNSLSPPASPTGVMDDAALSSWSLLTTQDISRQQEEMLQRRTEMTERAGAVGGAGLIYGEAETLHQLQHKVCTHPTTPGRCSLKSHVRCS